MWLDITCFGDSIVVYGIWICIRRICCGDWYSNANNNVSFELKSICGDSFKRLKKAKYASIYYNMYSNDLSLGFSLDRTIYTETVYFVKIGQSWYLGNISKLNQFW